MDNGNKIVLTGYDYPDVLKAFENGAEVDRYFKELKSKYPRLIQIAVEVDEMLDCDVLIVEDDIDKVCQYFKLLDKYPGAENLIACTKKIAVEYIANKIRDKSRVKLILLDFDLDNHNKDKFSAAEAKALYEYLTTNFYESVRIIGVTGFEGKYDNKDFRELETSMRERYGDLVLSKRFLDKDKIELFENILRNVYELGEKWEEKSEPLAAAEKLKEPASKPIDTARPVLPFKGQANLPPAKVITSAISLLTRLNAGIKLACPDNQEFFISKPGYFDKILSERNKPIKKFNGLTPVIKEKAAVINFLLNDAAYENEWKELRYQMKVYHLFENQLT